MLTYSLDYYSTMLWFQNATNTDICGEATLLGIEAIHTVPTIRFANPFTFINLKGYN